MILDVPENGEIKQPLWAESFSLLKVKILGWVIELISPSNSPLTIWLLPKRLSTPLEQDRQLGWDFLQSWCGDLLAAIDAVTPWDTFVANVTKAQKLAQPKSFNFLHRIGENYATLHRYVPQFLDLLKLRSAPAANGVLDVIEVFWELL